MKNSPRHWLSRLRARRFLGVRGFALPLVLVLLVIVTVALVSLLAVASFDAQSTRGYANGIQAQAVADVALDDIVTDFQTEIASAESQRATATTTAGLAVGMLPARILPGATNTRRDSPLLRVSTADAAYATAYAGLPNPPVNRASSVNSMTDRSLDGRYVSATRWASPQLTGSNTNIFQNLTTGPAWIYVTRAGSKAVNDSVIAQLRKSSDLTNTNQVVGRYAYAIYDVSGLLDVNVAGALATNDPGTKGGTYFARLDDANGVLGGSSAANFLHWRDSDQSATSATNAYAQRIYGDTNTVGQMESGSMALASSTNNRLFARQDLLDLKQSSGILSTNDSLSTLRTWSKSANAPGDIFVYDENAASQFQRLESYTTTSGTTIPAYNLAGNDASYPIKAGQPLFQRKFPLSRLRWFAKTDGSFNSAIHQHFGLVPFLLTVDGGINKFSGWEYTSPDSSAPATRIKSLSEIRGREPDFFEWLKAAIDPGSLGVAGGDVGVQYANDLDTSKDLQIIRIGANIIDQADADDVPTAIYTTVATVAGGSYPQTVFGVENLPYINEVDWSPHRQAPATNIDFWARFELWNPHLNAERNPSAKPKDKAQNLLSSFRVRFVGGAMMVIAAKKMNSASAGALGYSPLLNKTVAPTTKKYKGVDGTVEPTAFFDLSAAPAGKQLTFSLPNTNGSASSPGIDASAYQDPALVNDRNTGTGNQTVANNFLRFNPCSSPAGTTAINIGTLSLPEQAIDKTWQPTGASPAGTITLTPTNGTAQVYNVSEVGMKLFDDVYFYADGNSYGGHPTLPPSIAIEVQQGDGTWVPYQVIDRINDITFLNDTQTNADDPANWKVSTDKSSSGCRSFYEWNSPSSHRANLKVDPRTPRWGASPNSSSAGRSMKVNTNGITYAGSGKESEYCNWDCGRSTYPGFALNPDPNASGVAPISAVWSGTTNTGINGPYCPFPLLAMNEQTSGTVSYYYRETQKAGPGTAVSLVRRADYAALGDANSPDFPSIPGSQARPVILNRPFRSVGELGYVFRDTPWKTLDFFYPESADGNLAEIFSIGDGATEVGKINPLVAPDAVLSSVLAGVAKDDLALTPSVMSDTEKTNTVAALKAIANAAALPANLGDLLAKLNGPTSGVPSGVGDKIMKTQGEAAARALLGASDMRTWNFLIDFIAQAGDLTGASNTLAKFHITAERRYWVHLAIDRLTGQVVDLQMEPHSD